MVQLARLNTSYLRQAYVLKKKNQCLEENKNASHIFFDMNTYYIKWMNENDG